MGFNRKTTMPRERTRTQFTDDRYKKKSPKNKLWNFSIWKIMYQTMVREIAVRWNQIEASLVLMHAKMRDLGFIYEDGQVVLKDLESPGG